MDFDPWASLNPFFMNSEGCRMKALIVAFSSISHILRMLLSHFETGGESLGLKHRWIIKP